MAGPPLAWVGAAGLLLYLHGLVTGNALGWPFAAGSVLLIITGVALAAASQAPERAFLPLLAGFAALNLVFVLPHAGLFGYDSSSNLAATRLIAEHGWPLPPHATDSDIIRVISEYPALDHLTLAIAAASGVADLQVARLLPPLLSVFALVAFRHLLSDVLSERGRLLACLGFALIPTKFAFHSWYVREALGFPLFIVALLLLVRFCIQRAPNRLEILLLGLVSAGIILAHHLSGFLFMMISLGLAGYHFYLARTRRAEDARSYARMALVLAGVGLTMLASLVVYWQILSPGIFRSIPAVIETLLNGSFRRQEDFAVAYHASPRELIWVMTSGIISIAMVLLVIVMGRPLGQRAGRDLLVGFAATAAAIVAFSRATLYTKALYIHPERALTFSWVLLLVGTCGIIEGANRRAIAAGTVLVIAFAAVQLTGVPPDRYDPLTPPYYLDGSNRFFVIASEQAAYDYMAVHAHDQPVYGDQMVADFLGGILKRTVLVEPNLFRGEPPEDARGYFVVREENRAVVPSRTRDVAPLHADEEAAFANSTRYAARVYDSGDARIYIIASAG